MLISIVFPSIAGLWFEMDVLIQMYREFPTFKKIKPVGGEVGFPDSTLLCSGMEVGAVPH